MLVSIRIMGNIHLLMVELKTSTVSMAISVGVLLKMRVGQPQGTAGPLLDYTSFYRDTCLTMFLVAFIHNSQKLETAHMPMNG